MSEIRKFNDDEIRDGLLNGVFREDGLQIRHVELGYVVKVIKKNGESPNGIPTSVFQINNTTIYSADLRPVLKAIVDSHDRAIFDDLEEKYSLVLDSLDFYHSYGSGLEELQRNCTAASVAFDNRLRRALSGINVEEIEGENHEVLMAALDAYVKAFFVFIISTYLLHKERFGRDQVIIGKLRSFEGYVRRLYEQLLAPSWADEKGVNQINMESSLYAMYIFDSSYDLSSLQTIAAQDSRFGSAIAVFDFFKRYFTVEDSRRQYGRDYAKTMSWSISAKYNSKDSKRNSLANKLLLILQDIERLYEIREEIMQIKDAGEEYALVLREQGVFELMDK